MREKDDFLEGSLGFSPKNLSESVHLLHLVQLSYTLKQKASLQVITGKGDFYNIKVRDDLSRNSLLQVLKQAKQKVASTTENLLQHITVKV